MEGYNNISLNVKINIFEILADIATHMNFKNVYASFIKTLVIILLGYSTDTRINIKLTILKTYGILVNLRQIGISLIGFCLTLFLISLEHNNRMILNIIIKYTGVVYVSLEPYS